jgi:hypothetical protein
MPDPKPLRPLHVFLCHSSADKPAVRNLYRRLRKDGIDAWLDEEKLLPGQDWQLAIPKAVRDSDIVIVCLSRGSINRAGYIQKEIKFALDEADKQPEGAIFIVPLKLEQCDVPDRLSRWQWVNLFEKSGYERLMRTLRFRAESLSAKIALPSLQPTTEYDPGPSKLRETPNTVIDRSGGIDVRADQVTTEDVVGRDKIVQHQDAVAGDKIVQYIEHYNAAPVSNQAAQEQLAKEKAEANRLAKQKAEAERRAEEKAEQKRLAREKAEEAQLAKQPAEAERAASSRTERKQRAREKAEAIAILKLRLQTLFTRGRIRGGLIALLIFAALAVIIGAIISGTKAASVSVTQTAIAVAAVPLSTPSSTATLISIYPRATHTPTATPTAAPTTINATVTKTPSLTPTKGPTITQTSTETLVKTPTPTTRLINTSTPIPTYTPQISLGADHAVYSDLFYGIQTVSDGSVLGLGSGIRYSIKNTSSRNFLIIANRGLGVRWPSGKESFIDGIGVNWPGYNGQLGPGQSVEMDVGLPDLSCNPCEIFPSISASWQDSFTKAIPENTWIPSPKHYDISIQQPTPVPPLSGQVTGIKIHSGDSHTLLLDVAYAGLTVPEFYTVRAFSADFCPAKCLVSSYPINTLEQAEIQATSPSGTTQVLIGLDDVYCKSGPIMTNSITVIFDPLQGNITFPLQYTWCTK